MFEALFAFAKRLIWRSTCLQGCSKSGFLLSWVDWVRRATFTSRYIYSTQSFRDDEADSPYFFVVREPLDRATPNEEFPGEALGWCGGWGKTAKIGNYHRLAFRSGRLADEKVRRLRMAIPERWELVLAVLTIGSGVGLNVMFELVLNR